MMLQFNQIVDQAGYLIIRYHRLQRIVDQHSEELLQHVAVLLAPFPKSTRQEEYIAS
jgi:hypothetical protein